MTDYIYDIETYPNIFTMTVIRSDLGSHAVFEISERRNDGRTIVNWMRSLNKNDRMVGFNNVGFDYPVLHYLVMSGNYDAGSLYQKAMAIIEGADTNRWVHRVKPSDYVVQQVDLYLIHHFDNRARATSLKKIEFAMGMPSVEALPFAPGTWLNVNQMDTLLRYNLADVRATQAFYRISKDKLALRDELSQKFNVDFTNFNDTKIGKQYLAIRLEQAGVQLYDYGPEGRQPRQTKRPIISLNDAILPWITFITEPYQRILEWLRSQTITETKGVFKDLSVPACPGGIDLYLGTGGLHGSLESIELKATDDILILDLDVTSYYPSLAIVNRWYPEHLTEAFVDIYEDVFEQRQHYAKGTSENAMFKLALNGVFGDSNNPYSIFYDPLFTMRITINGQLLLMMLIENLASFSFVKLIQANTDGITIALRRDHLAVVMRFCDMWQSVTGLHLEQAEFKRIFIRDVNNYMAEVA